MIDMKFLKLFIILFLFPHMEVVSCSSSCDELQNIIYNLPGNCGGGNFQLDCKKSNPTSQIQSTTFLVKDISFQTKTFRLVDPSYSPTGDKYCHLPNQTVSSNYTLSSFLYKYSNFSFIYFINCTQEIQSPRYVLVPCMNRSNSKVYAVSEYGMHGVSGLHDSCRLVGRAIADAQDDLFEGGGYALIMQAIEKGVLVNWTRAYSLPSCSALGRCRSTFLQAFTDWNDGFSEVCVAFFRVAPILPLLLLYELPFLECLYQDSSSCFIIISIFYITFQGAVIMLFHCIHLKGVLSFPIPLTLDIIFNSLAVARMVLTPLAVCSFLIHKWWGMSSSISTIEKFLRKNELLYIRHYDFIEISIMTNHFREKLGQGGFGSVYKGKLLSGQQVAVKILSTPIGDGDDFISEVATIGRIHHTNIVRLIGFCSEGSKRALIYAYMPNGSLDKYIFCSNSAALIMEKRREIAIGIARGIDYLHRGCEMQILHFDIKPHNILLDHNLTPKISDFGLAKLYPRDYSLVTLSMARGTIGYIAPELISRTFGAISYKADVYSFGMLLMEMVSGRRNVNNHAESSSQVYYPSWVYDQLNLPEMAHNLSSNVGKFGEIEERLYKIALWCIQMKASNRPTMSRVIEMLQSNADSVEMPPRPFAAFTPHEFSVRPSGNESCSSIELSSISEEIWML